MQRSPNGIQQSTWHNTTISQSSPAKAQQIRLHQLQAERERLKQRQQEIRRQEIRRQEIMMRSTSDLQMDPFLGLTDHSRQESGDSGLGIY